MSIKAQTHVWESDLSRPQMLVLLAMADWADDHGEGVYPSVNRVAWKTGYEPRQIRRILAQLRKAGLLIRVRAPENGRGVEYTIALHQLPKKESFKDWLARHKAAGEDMSDTDEEQEGEVKMTPLSPETGGGGLSRPPGGVSQDSHIRKGTIRNTSEGERVKTRSVTEAEQWARRIADSVGMSDEEKERVFGE